MKKLLNFAFLLTVIAMLIGCGGSSDRSDGPQYYKEERAKSPTIAKVGQSEIKLFMVEDFRNMYSLEFNTADEEFESKKEYLDTLISLYIMVEAAYAQDLHKDSEILETVESSKPDFIREELFRVKILPNIEVTDAEAKLWHDKMDEEIRISNIFILDSTLADSVYKEIQNGADFTTMARKFSEDSQTKFEGGDFGYRGWGDLTEEFQTKVFDLPINQPVLFNVLDGWDIAQVTERRDFEIDSYDLMEQPIKMRIQSIKRNTVQREIFEELFEKANIKINEETTEFILDKVETLYPDVIGGVPFRKNTFNPDDLAQYEQNMILASYKGGETLLGDYLRLTATWPDAQRPPFSETEQLKTAIFRLVNLDLLEAEAYEMKLQDSDNYKDAMRFYKDQLMATKMREIIITEKTFVSDEEVAEYFRNHSEEYFIPKKYHLQEILCGSEVEAEDMINQLSQGKDFGQLAESHTLRPGRKERQGDLGYVSPGNYPTIYKVASTLNIGQISEQFPVGDKWSVIKLLEIQQAENKPFEAVAKVIKTDLENNKRETAIGQWYDENREKTNIDVDYDMIWKTIDKDAYEN